MIEHADNEFMHHQDRQRRDRLHVDMIGGTMQRQDNEGQRQRDPELDAHRDIHLAESRQQHHHRADAGKHQHEGGAKGGQKRDINAHGALVSRFRSSHTLAATFDANFGIKGTLELYDSSVV